MNLINIIQNHRSRYIIITFLVSAIGFFKSFFLLKIFDYKDLGILALAQTVTTTVSLFQFGAITGGYRIYSYKPYNILEKINSAVFMFFLLLGVLTMLVGFIAPLIFDVNLSMYFIFVITLIALISLYSSWVVCKLLGTNNVAVLNRAQFFSASISFLFVLMAYRFGIQIALYGLLLQPAILIGISYVLRPKLIPTYSLVNFRRYIFKIISLGFIPYLTTALTLLNSQFGRWIITISLGTLILGKTSLATLYIALVSVFPGAVSNMFFPLIISNFENHKYEELKSSLKKQFLVLGIYYIIVIAGTLVFGKILVGLLLSNHLDALPLVYAIAPSLLFLHLSVPAITLFNAAKKFKLILYGSLISVATYLMLLCGYLFNFKVNLIGFYLIESISALFFFMYNIHYFFKIYKSRYYEKTICE